MKKLRRLISAFLSATMAVMAVSGTMTAKAAPAFSPTAASNSAYTAQNDPDPSELNYTMYPYRYPNRTVFEVGEKVDVSGGTMSVRVTDKDGNFVNTYELPFDDPEFEVRCSEFTKPGEYDVNIIRKSTGKSVASYPVRVVEKFTPVTGTYSRVFTIVDKDTREDIKGLECEFIDVISGKIVYSWNTSDKSEAVISGLNYKFESSYSEDAHLYALRIVNMQDTSYRYTGFGGFCGVDDKANTTYYRLAFSYNENGVPEDTVIQNEVRLIDNSVPREPVKSSTTRYTGTLPKYTTTTTTKTTPVDDRKEADKYKVVCMTDSLRSSFPIDFEIMGFDKEERDWGVSYKGNSAAACKTNYLGNHRFTLLDPPSGDIKVIVTFSDRSECTIDLHILSSTTKPIQPGSTRTTTTVTYDQSAYPKTGTYTEVVKIVDYDSGEPVKGLDCELIDNRTEEVVYKWNTSDKPVAEIGGLKYLFETPRHNSQSYVLRIKNLPDEYAIGYGSFPKANVYFNAQYAECRLQYSESMADGDMTTVDQLIVLNLTAQSTTSTNTTATSSIKTVPTTTVPSTALTTDTTTVNTGQLLHELSVGISIVDEEGDPIDGIDMKLYRQRVKWRNSTEYYYDGEKELIETWNTSQQNPYLSKIFYEDDDYVFIFECEKLPAQYNCYGESSFRREILSKFQGTKTLDVTLKKTENPEIEYPFTGQYSLTLNVVNDETGEPMKDLNCRLVRQYVGSPIAEWNTTVTPELTVRGLDYWFEYSSLNSCRYVIYIDDLPEGYNIISKGHILCRSAGGSNAELRIDKVSEFVNNGYKLTETVYVSGDPAKTTKPSLTTTRGPATPPIWTTTTTVPTTTTSGGETGGSSQTTPAPLYGDANCDGKVTIADAAAILQYLGNGDRYKLSAQGKQNADCDGKAGITTADAVFIQKQALSKST